MAKNTKAIKDHLYPIVEKALDSAKVRNEYKKFVKDFFYKRDEEVYDALPCSRILCSEDEMDRLFTVLGINKVEVKTIISETY